MAILLGHAGFDVEQEQNDSGLLEMKQEGLIDRMIKPLGVDVDTVSEKESLAEAKSLAEETDREGSFSDFSFISVVGMLLYLPGHSQCMPNVLPKTFLLTCI